jgi:hypothetical protein
MDLRFSMGLFKNVAAIEKLHTCSKSKDIQLPTAY